MSKIIKAILIGAYGAVILQFIRSLQMNRYEKYIELNYMFRPQGILKKMQHELRYLATQNITPNTIVMTEMKPFRLPTDLKFILKFTSAFSHYTSSIFRNEQWAFVDSNCSYYNCYFTNNKNLLTDIRNFDAILFDVENTWEQPPPLRSTYQRYIFTASESSFHYPVCHDIYDTFYNWTWTYKLDSDIRWTYITIVDLNNTVVGPKVNMTWVSNMDPISPSVKKILMTKRKMAAWFVSNCLAKNERMTLAYEIAANLERFGYVLDVFGLCGNKICPRERMEDCLDILQEEYYFYLAFENSKSDDYVTEKILHAVQHYTVPVVYGGANYSRFLPPGSYINAGRFEPYVVASLMMEAVRNKELYYNYFRWTNYYIYKAKPPISDVCTLCRLLNEEHEPKVVNNLRYWWNYNYKEQCDKGIFEHQMVSFERFENYMSPNESAFVKKEFAARNRKDGWSAGL